MLLIIALQYNNHHTFCPDFIEKKDKVDDALLPIGHDSTESILVCLKDGRTWKSSTEHPTAFGTTPCFDYNRYPAKCHLYTSLYRSLIDYTVCYQ